MLSVEIPPELLSLHQKRIKKWLAEDRTNTFKIFDTCRFENGGIIPLEALVSAGLPDNSDIKISAFVPAAGASSRYYQVLDQIINQSSNGILSPEQRQHLRDLHFDSWPLHNEVKMTLNKWATEGVISNSELQLLKSKLALPKALQPIAQPYSTFLSGKLQEHQHLNSIQEQIFVVTPQFRREFETEITRCRPDKPVHLMEQGLELSTIRFDLSGEPWTDSAGMPSVVPAGHGALSRLFPKTKQLTGCRALFIRNIDNYSGDTPVVQQATETFLSGCRRLLTALDDIRAFLEVNRVMDAEVTARTLAQSLNLSPAKGLPDGLTSLAHLIDCQRSLFHTPESMVLDAIAKDGAEATLRALYRRPLNVLGQVPNVNKDVGGTPCFVEVEGEAVKLCLEVPHASESDKRDFLANPAKATHFNPVFVFCEVPGSPDFYDGLSNDFWVVSEKKFAGQKVLYHETVLYELIGNSLASNCVFAEIPRILFKPHKAVQDGAISAR
jgi:hypothetical protein